MSEQYFQRPEDEHENSHIDDPLAELARIVTGDESRAESASTHQKPQRSENQNSDRQPKHTARSQQSVLTATQSEDANISQDLEENPFAKFIVKPVDIPEGPRKARETPVRETRVKEVRAQDTRASETQAKSEAVGTSIFSGELPHEDVAPPTEESVVDPFADIDLEFADMLEAGLADEEVGNPEELSDRVEQVEGDGLDLESQLMAELNGEEEPYVPQHVKKAQSEQGNAPNEQPVPQHNDNLSELSAQQPANVDVFGQTEQAEDQVEDPETAEFLEAFAAEQIQVSDQDFEANLEQKISMIDEGTVTSGQQSPSVPRQNSNVQNKIDAVLSSLERPVNVVQNEGANLESNFDEQNFGAAFDSGDDDFHEHSTAPVRQSSNDDSIAASMDQMSSTLAGSVNTQTDLPEFPEAREFVSESNDPISEPQPSDPHLFYSESDYANDERQINESVHALQDDLAAQSMEIDSAFSDAFAEELSLDMEMQNPDNQIHQAQMEFDHQQSDIQTAQNQDYHEYPADNLYSDEYSDEYPAMSHEADMGVAGVGALDYRQLERPMTSAEQNEMEIDQALVGALRPQRNKNSGFKMAAIALGGAVAIGAGVVGYGLIGETGNNGDPVLVRADQSDFKVKPDQPGGKEIANQDQPVYVSMNGKKTDVESQEKLVSSNVKPVDIDSNNESVNLSKSSERLSNNQANSAQNAANAFVQPRKVKTVIVRADGTIVTSEGTKVADLGSVPAANLTSAQIQAGQSKSIDGAKGTNIIPVPSANPFVAKKSVITDTANRLKVAAANQILAADPNNLVANSRSVTTPVNTLTTAVDQNVEAQVVKTVKVPVQQVKATALDTRINNALAANPGAYKVQISSQRSQEAAEATYQNLKQKFASLLEGQPKEIRAVNVEDKGTFYRVQIPVGGMPEAASFCKRYKAAGGSCFVTR